MGMITLRVSKDEERILEAVNNARKERIIDSKEVWGKLGI